MDLLLVGLLGVLSAPLAAAAPSPGPPVAPVREVRDLYFGTAVIDPYRWLESDTPEVATWVKAQAEYTQSHLAALPTRATLLARIHQLDNAAPQVRWVERWNGRVFSLQAEPGSDTSRLYVRDSLEAPARLLIDPDALARPGATFSIDYYTPSLDGKLVAYGLSPRGSEASVLHVIDATTGKALPDVIDRARYADVSWLDERSFVYTRQRKVASGAPEAERLTGSRTHLHVLGTDAQVDPPLFGPGLSARVPMGSDAMPIVRVIAGCPQVFGIISRGVQPEMGIYTAPRVGLRGTRTRWQRLASPKDEITSFEVHGDDLYLLSTRGARRGKILKTSLTHPRLDRATVIVPESDAVISWFSAGKDALYARILDGGVGRILRIPFDGKPATPIDAPAQGSISDLFAETQTDGVLFRLDAWTAAPRLFVFDPTQGKPSLTKVMPASPVDFAGIVSSEQKASSADGTVVPLSLIHRKELVRDGSNPVLLVGYGSYGSVFEPYFQPMDLAWLERGGVMAVCHPRGGGEKGEDWHKAGMLASKTNTIDDFVACARWLIDQKYTSPARLAGEGTSAGGIMLGGAIVRRPELFAAAVLRVGMVNALRFEQIPIGPFNTSEFGSVKTKAGFAMLQAIDAYHAIKPGTPYPAVLLTTGATDPRVSPWQMTKMAARLQAASSSGKPILLRVDYGSGHGIGTTKTQQEAERADRLAFLLSQVGQR